MRRRRYIATSGAILTGSLAGCSGNEGDEPEEGTEAADGATDSPTDSPTDATATRTATPTEDETTATEEASDPVSDVRSSPVTPEETETATPTGTDPSIDTPTATATASATETPQPTPTPASDGQQYTFQGGSDSVTDPFAVEGGFTSFDMAHDGDSNFQVELIDTRSGDTQEFLANEIGDWEGLLPYDVPEGEYVLDVTADGNWEIVVRQPRHTLADAETVPVMGNDDYPNYLGPVEFEGFHTVSGRYEGDSNFVVWLLDEAGGEVDLLFNEIGQFEGETTTNYQGMGYIRVEATGPWQVDVE